MPDDQSGCVYNPREGHAIPFNRSSIVGREYEYIKEAMACGQIAGDRAFGRKCEALLNEEFRAPRVLLTTSCTHSLEMSALLLDIKSGDEVIVPSFTFVSTANAFALRGANVVFADIRPDSLNIDPDDIERKITPRTRAIVVVHYSGIACELDRILEIARAHGVPVIEDNAHGLFGRWRGKPLGTFGSLATQSFHGTKNFTCGEGGALVINDERFVERAEIIREKGTNRSHFCRGQVDRYSWVELGSSYVMSELLAAFLYGQLEQREAIQARRRAIWDKYDRELRGWATDNGIATPVVPRGAEHPYHMYYILLPSLEDRQALIAHLSSRGILAVFHYVPLHLSEMGRRFGARPGDCPVTENVSERVLRLPFFHALDDENQRDIIAAVTAYRPISSHV